MPEEKWEITDPKYQDFQAVQDTAYEPFSEKFQQVVYDLNQTSVAFHASDARGYTISDLRPEDVILYENGKLVEDFGLQVKSLPERNVDFVFVVDTTMGMDKIVAHLKNQVALFQQGLDAAKLKASFCLLTFADHTEKKCDRMGTLSDLKNELGRMKFKLSVDSNENQLRALIDAVNTSPWRQGARRSIVLVTNAGFSYAPENKGNAGSDAPTYEETFQLLKRSGTAVFVVGPTKTKGYDQMFGSLSTLSGASEYGRFYDFSKVENNELKISDLFFDWAHFIPIDYQLNYVVENQQGLNPELPLQQRQMTMSFQNQDWFSGPLYVSSNLPNGRGAYVKKWKLSKNARGFQKNLKVLVNGEPYGRFARVNGTHLEMDTAAPAGAEIQVYYDLDRFQEQVKTEIMVLPSNIDFSRFIVRANGVSLGLEQIRLSQNSQGHYLLNPGLLTADFEDPLNIIGLKKLRIEVFGRRRIEQF